MIQWFFALLFLAGITLILGARLYEVMLGWSVPVSLSVGGVTVLISLGAVNGLPPGVVVVAVMLAVATAGAMLARLYTSSGSGGSG